MTAPCPDCGAGGMTYGMSRGSNHAEDCPRIGTPAQFGPPWRDLTDAEIFEALERRAVRDAIAWRTDPSRKFEQ